MEGICKLMKTRVVLNRGSNTENDLFTGFPGEIVYDTTNQTIRIHDGSTAGGKRLATVAANNLFSTNSISSNIISSGVGQFTNVTSNVANVTTATITTFASSNATITTGTVVTLSSNLITSNNITINNQPTNNAHATNKSYVDTKLRLSIALWGI